MSRAPGKQREPVDLYRLYADGNSREWNEYLSRCLRREDYASLGDIYYRVQAGADALVKKNLFSGKIVLWYPRLLRSIEQTVKMIYRHKFPCMLDDPLREKMIRDTDEWKNQSVIKRRRDQEFERWLRENSY